VHPGVFAHGLEPGEKTVLELVTFRTRRGWEQGIGRVLRITGEQPALFVIQGRGDYLWLALERRQHLSGIFAIAEGQRRRAVRGDDATQRAGLLQVVAAERNVVISDEGRAGDQQDGRAGEQHHRGELAADGQRHAIAPP
jgi:hypothetical protein